MRHAAHEVKDVHDKEEVAMRGVKKWKPGLGVGRPRRTKRS